MGRCSHPEVFNVSGRRGALVLAVEGVRTERYTRIVERIRIVRRSGRADARRRVAGFQQGRKSVFLIVSLKK